jgi:Trypsin-like peptidase domain
MGHVPMAFRLFGALLIVFGVACARYPVSANAALLPSQFLDCVVAIGINVPVKGQPSRTEFRVVATGFFYGFLIKEDSDPKKRLYETYLITAKHVIDDFRANKLEEFYIRVNPTEASAQSPEFGIPLRDTAGQNQWFFDSDPAIDLAAIRVNYPLLQAANLKVEFFPNDQAAFDRNEMKAHRIQAGDGVFVLGFPLELNGIQRNYLTVRQGIIARLNDMLDQSSKTFLIDSCAFPGSSGGPVVLKPELASIAGTPPQRQAVLLGVVLSYVPYVDIAISQQTKRPRVTFEENSGLTNILPIDYINNAIKNWRSVPSQGEASPTSAPPSMPQKQ